jgi:hypothetical protein
VQQKHAPFYESTCLVDELDGKPNHTILKKMVARQRTHLKNHLRKKLCSMGFK